jgi:hypothetical protein
MVRDQKHPSLLDCLTNPTVFGQWFHSQTVAEQAAAEKKRKEAAEPAPSKSDNAR